MSDRREMRRSSPDAPQGFVPVLTVFAGLVVVAVVGVAGFIGSGSDTSEESVDDTTEVPDSAPEHGPTTGAPTTTLIRGSTTTALFVTTTTPITTTTTTTSTTLPGPALAAGDAEIVFGPDQRSATFTLRSAHPDGIEFEITQIPAGFEADPSRGRVAEDSPVEIRIRMTDSERARDGTLRIEGSDGSRASVTIRIRDRGRDLTVRTVRIDPTPPVCRTTSRLLVDVEGDEVDSVAARVRVGESQTTVGLSRTGGTRWEGTIPGGERGASLSGTVLAVDEQGETATGDFSATIASGPECADG